MKVEWNQDKAAANLKKHGIDFADAAWAETRQYYKGVSL